MIGAVAHSYCWLQNQFHLPASPHSQFASLLPNHPLYLHLKLHQNYVISSSQEPSHHPVQIFANHLLALDTHIRLAWMISGKESCYKRRQGEASLQNLLSAEV